MILRLSGADFSANNIGKIDIVRELSEDTISLLSNFTREITNEQRFAVQDFINGLKSNGIWSYIENLYIPSLAGDLSETLYDVKGRNLDATPNSTYYELVGYSLRIKADYNASQSEIVTAKVKTNASQANLHLMAYVKDMGYNANYAVMLLLLSNGDTASLNSVGVHANYICGFNGNSSEKNYSGTYSMFSSDTEYNGFIGYVSNTSKIFTVVDKEYKTMDIVPSSDYTYTNVDTYIGTNAINKSRFVGGYNIISTGAAMTKEMMIKYNELCDELMSKLVA